MEIIIEKEKRHFVCALKIGNSIAYFRIKSTLEHCKEFQKVMNLKIKKHEKKLLQTLLA